MGLLCASEEKQPTDFTPCDSPCYDAHGQLDLPQVCWWWSLHILHVPQHGSPRSDVLLLPCPPWDRRCRSTSGGRSTSPACSCSSLSHSPSTEACHSLQTATTPRLLCSSYSSLEFSSSASSLISTSRPTQRKRNKIH